MAGNSDNGEAAAWIIGICMAIAAAIYISRFLFPIFAVATVVTFIALIFLLFSQGHEDDSFGYVGIAFIVCLVCTGITYGIGYGVPKTVVGQVSLEVNGAVVQTQQAFDDAIDQTIEESCKTLTPESCQSLQSSVSMFRTTQDVLDMAEGFRKTATVVKKIDDVSKTS